LSKKGNSLALAAVPLLTALMFLVAVGAAPSLLGPAGQMILDKYDASTSMYPTPPYGGQSPSCFVNSACRSNAGFTATVAQFLASTALTSPNLALPSTACFQRFLCNILSKPSFGEMAEDDAAGGDAMHNPKNQGKIFMSLTDLFLKFLVTTYWITEVGTNPYPVPTFWWCFIDNNTVVAVTPGVVPGPSGWDIIKGVLNITNSYGGLGHSAASGGQGFYVSIVQLNGTWATVKQDPIIRTGHSRAFKQLVCIDICAGGPGTTKTLDLYSLDIDVALHPWTYPKYTITHIMEIINLFQTLSWLGDLIPGVTCLNCPEGIQCTPT